jgi:organic hydroperoxide reductase OsmC/OhrA
MLWYLHFCADNQIVVESYEDAPRANMALENNGSGKFTSAELRPTVIISDPEKISLATSLHEQAHQYCFIANSVNFPILLTPNVQSN